MGEEAWLAQLADHTTHDLGVVSLSSMLAVKKKKEKKCLVLFFKKTLNNSYLQISAWINVLTSTLNL